MGDRLKKAVLPLAPEDQSPEHMANLGFREGACTMLDDDAFCAIHKVGGEEILPDICAAFPRIIRRAGNDVEMTAAMACPEIARMVMLDDDACEWVDLEEALFSRWGIAEPVDLDRNPPQGAAYPILRQALCACLLNSEHTALEAFSQALGLARRLDGLMAHGVRLSSGAIFASAGNLPILRPAGPTLMAVERVRNHLIGALHEFTEGPVGQTRRWLQKSRRMDWERGRSFIEKHHGPRMNRWIRNFSAHFFSAEPHVNSQSLRLHLCRIAVQVGVLRVLLISHPAILDPVRHEEATMPSGIDDLLVERAHTFTRYLMNSDVFRRSLWSIADEIHTEDDPEVLSWLDM
jgi:lysine-N-methylase